MTVAARPGREADSADAGRGRDAIGDTPVRVVMSKVNVVDNQVDAALKQLKKLLLRDGAFQEMKRRAHYEKPSVKRKRKAAAARKRRRRALARARSRDTE